MKERVLATARYITENKATIRQAARAMGVSKSTVSQRHERKTQKLDEGLYLRVRRILEYNLSVRHLRGGRATKNKYVRK